MIGNWFTDKNDLPGFEYTGSLPYSAVCKDGTPVKLPEDPWFLMGNYQLTLFAHVSGIFELITGQRSWGRLNMGSKPNTGVNLSSVKVDVKSYSLAGLSSAAANPDLCKRKFGCGYAQYDYDLDGISVSRKINIKPSFEIDGGQPAFVLSLTLKNLRENGVPAKIELSEIMGVHYSEIQYQFASEEAQKIKFDYEVFEGSDTGDGNSSGSTKLPFALYKITGKSNDPLLVCDRDAMSMYDAFPPSVFMASLSKDFHVTAQEGTDDLKHSLQASATFTLKAGEEKTLNLIIGFIPDEKYSVSSIVKDLISDTGLVQGGPDPKDAPPEIDFSSDWKKVLPSFSEEADPTMRRELIWHAYSLEAMATYSSYYHETKIPQGTIYDYNWGKHASARDNLQHALPCVYYNPKLAKSTLRYLMERTTSFGEVKLIEYGNGYAEHEGYFTSDQQLFMFLLLSEYLRVTGDYDFLKEELEPFPCDGSGKKVTVLHMVEKLFAFLRDTIGVGPHGLVRLYNSDWNDTIYYIEKVPYLTVVRGGESHMNSAMVCSIFQTLIPQLKKGGAAQKLTESMEVYRSSIFQAYIKDCEGLAFPRRMYFAGKPYGEENMFLEPMGYTLQMKDYPLEGKKILYKEMQKRLYQGEKLGARQQQTPQFDSPDYDKGSRENGGFWWALNAPVICGLASWDKAEARRLLQNMTLSHMSECFPDYWCCYWDASDNVESSLIPQEGLSDQSFTYSDVPHCCAHPHAWILYCWYYLR